MARIGTMPSNRASRDHRKRPVIYLRLLSSRWNRLPVKRINGSRLMRHEHPARSLVELMQIGKTPSGANSVLHHTTKTFNGIEVVSTMGWQEMQPKLLVPVCQRRRELFRP